MGLAGASPEVEAVRRSATYCLRSLKTHSSRSEAISLSSSVWHEGRPEPSVRILASSAAVVPGAGVNGFGIVLRSVSRDDPLMLVLFA